MTRRQLEKPKREEEKNGSSTQTEGDKKGFDLVFSADPANSAHDPRNGNHDAEACACEKRVGLGPPHYFSFSERQKKNISLRPSPVGRRRRRRAAYIIFG